MADLLVRLLCSLAVLSLLTTLCMQGCVHLVLRRRLRPASVLPPISILKPLKGLDDGLLENLLALARQEYPAFEIICGVEDPSDAALDVVQEVRRQCPTLALSIVAHGTMLGLNPKVSNLARMAKRAKYPTVLISDSNVRPNPGYLQAMARDLAQDGVGLVSSMLGGVGDTTLGARFDNLHFNAFVAASVSGARLVGDHVCVVGKSMLFRLGDLERVGGWTCVRNILAEDYVLGQRFVAAGFGVTLSPHVLPVVHTERTLRAFVERHVRWAQMRRRLSLGYYVGELLLNPIPWLIVAIVATATLRSASAWTVWSMLGGIALKCMLDLWTGHTLVSRPLDGRDVGAIVLKDCLVLAIWCVGLFRRTLAWRGHALRIGPGSTLAHAELYPMAEPLAPR